MPALGCWTAAICRARAGLRRGRAACLTWSRLHQSAADVCSLRGRRARRAPAKCPVTYALPARPRAATLIFRRPFPLLPGTAPAALGPLGDATGHPPVARRSSSARCRGRTHAVRTTPLTGRRPLPPSHPRIEPTPDFLSPLHGLTATVRTSFPLHAPLVAARRCPPLPVAHSACRQRQPCRTQGGRIRAGLSGSTKPISLHGDRQARRPSSTPRSERVSRCRLRAGRRVAGRSGPSTSRQGPRPRRHVLDRQGHPAGAWRFSVFGHGATDHLSTAGSGAQTACLPRSDFRLTSRTAGTGARHVFSTGSPRPWRSAPFAHPPRASQVTSAPSCFFRVGTGSPSLPLPQRQVSAPRKRVDHSAKSAGGRCTSALASPQRDRAASASGKDCLLHRCWRAPLAANTRSKFGGRAPPRRPSASSGPPSAHLRHSRADRSLVCAALSRHFGPLVCPRGVPAAH